MTFAKSLRRLRHEKTGATMIEYGLIASFVALVLVGALTQLSGGLSDTFGNVMVGIEGAGNGDGSGGSGTSPGGTPTAAGAQSM